MQQIYTIPVLSKSIYCIYMLLVHYSFIFSTDNPWLLLCFQLLIPCNGRKWADIPCRYWHRHWPQKAVWIPWCGMSCFMVSHKSIQRITDMPCFHVWQFYFYQTLKHQTKDGTMVVVVIPVCWPWALCVSHDHSMKK